MATTLSTLRTQLRYDINELVAKQFSDTLLNQLINKGCQDTAIKTLCCEEWATAVNSVAGQREYAPISVPSGNTIIKVKTVLYDKKALYEIPIKAAGRIHVNESDLPLGFYQFRSGSSFTIGLDPVPTAGVTNGISCLCAVSAKALSNDADQTNIPDYLTHLPLMFAFSLAKFLSGEGVASAKIMNNYIGLCLRYRPDLIEFQRDAIEEIKLPLRRV
jgi:hypothetical protein